MYISVYVSKSLSNSLIHLRRHHFNPLNRFRIISDPLEKEYSTTNNMKIISKENLIHEQLFILIEKGHVYAICVLSSKCPFL